MKRAAAALALTAVLLAPGSAALAAAVPAPQPPAPTQGPPVPEQPTAPGDVVTGDEPDAADRSLGERAGGIFLDGIGCVIRGAPTPEIPENVPATQGPTLGGGPAIPDFVEPKVYEQDGLYATYGVAGTFWTTWDSRACSPAAISSDSASGVNSGISAADGLVAQAIVWSSDPETGLLGAPTAEAIGETLRTALLDPWLRAGYVGLAVVMVVLMLGRRVSQALKLAAASLLVVSFGMFLADNPTRLPEISREISTGISAEVSEAVISLAGGPAVNLPPDQTAPEAFYRSTTYLAWVNGAFGADAQAAEEYGPRFLEAQAYTRDEWAAIRAGDVDETGLAEEKQERWLQAAADLQESNPSAFQRWSGESGGRMGAAIVHLLFSIPLGFVALLSAFAAKVAEMAATLVGFLWVAFVPVMIFSERFRRGIAGLFIVALLAIPLVAVMSGIAFGFVAAAAAVAPSVQALWPWVLSILAAGALAIVLTKEVLKIFGGTSTMGGSMGRHARRGSVAAAQAVGRGGQVVGLGAAGAIGAVVAGRGSRGADGADGSSGSDGRSTGAEVRADPTFRERRAAKEQAYLDRTAPQPAPPSPSLATLHEETSSTTTPATTPQPAGQATTTAPDAPRLDPTSAPAGAPASAGATTSTPPTARTSSPVAPAADSEDDQMSPTPLAHETLARYRARVPEADRVQPPPVVEEMPAPRTVVDSDVARSVASAGRYVPPSR